MLNMEQLMHVCGYLTKTLQRAVWILFGKPLWQSTSPQSPNQLLAVSERVASIVVILRHRNPAALAQSRWLRRLKTL